MHGPLRRRATADTGLDQCDIEAGAEGPEHIGFELVPDHQGTTDDALHGCVEDRRVGFSEAFEGGRVGAETSLKSALDHAGCRARGDADRAARLGVQDVRVGQHERGWLP